MANNSLSWDGVLHAIHLAMTEAKRLGVDPQQLAESKRTQAAVAGDYTAARIWRDVWVSLMTQKYLPATLRVHEHTMTELQNRSGDRTKH
jgi:hypothetical protein